MRAGGREGAEKKKGDGENSLSGLKAKKKGGEHTEPLYDGLVEFSVFSLVAVDCRNKTSGNNIGMKYLFFVWSVNKKVVCKINVC